jgi:hypothetical protein
MKTKTFFMLCLILGIGLTRLSAQNGQQESTKTYSEYFTGTWSDPVFCEGVLVDWLDLTIPVHHIAKYVKGEWLHCFTQGTGTAVSENNGEIFTIKEIGKQDNNIMPDGSWEYVANIHFNAIGSSGTHYIVFATLYWNGKVENSRSVCLGN